MELNGRPVRGDGVLRLQPPCRGECRRRLLKLETPHEQKAPRGVRVGKRRVERQRTAYGDFGTGIGRLEIHGRVVVRTDHMGEREPRPAACERGVTPHGRFQIPDRAVPWRGPALRPVEAPFEIQVVRHGVAGASRRHADRSSRVAAARAHSRQPRRERGDDGGRERILHREHVGAGALEGVAPEQLAIARAGQLRGEANAIAGAPHSAFDNGTHAQRLAHLGREDRLALEGETRGAAGQAQAGELREGVRQFVGETVAEVLIVRVAAGIDEGQHGERGNGTGGLHTSGARCRCACGRGVRTSHAAE